MYINEHDTHSGSGDGFSGCWGVYPWLPSGNIIVSDMQGGLFVLGVNYTRASHLKGQVLDANTSFALDDVEVAILGENVVANSNILGNYMTGIANAGTFDVVYSKSGYFSDTISVQLIADSTIVQDVQLVPFPTYQFSGKVLDAVTMLPIQNVMVNFADSLNDIDVLTDVNGEFSIENLPLGTYEIKAGIWGHRTECLSYVAEEDSSNFTILLNSGYYDDFSFDFGWQVTGNATSGIWEMAMPKGLNIGPNNIAPEGDVIDDCGEICFITGNSGENPGEDELADGNSIITSPVFDATLYTNAFLKFNHWFFSGFGASQDDSLKIKLTNGIDEVLLNSYNASSNSNSSWTPNAYKISDYLGPTNSMQLIIETGDNGVENITEAAFDKFEVVDVPVSVNELDLVKEISIYPNPFISVLEFSSSKEIVSIEMFDLTGKKLYAESGLNELNYQLNIDLPQGVFLAKIQLENGAIEVRKIVRK